MNQTTQKNNENECLWTVQEVRDETPLVKTLVLEAQGAYPDFIPGQYLTVKLAGFEPIEGKAYSISSIPNGKTLSITIKKMGRFSEALLLYKPFDILTTSAPYGFFYPEKDAKDLAFIAGGIGIAPCRSIIESLSKNNDARRITLLYSNQTENNIVFRDKLEELAEENPLLSVTYFITRERALSSGIIASRITSEYIAKNISNLSETDFFLCGSIQFTRAMWLELQKVGVRQEQIYTEGFF